MCPAVYFHKGVISGLNTLLTAIIAIFVFGTFILIHEFGHFIAAKKFGVKVNELKPLITVEAAMVKANCL